MFTSPLCSPRRTFVLSVALTVVTAVLMAGCDLLDKSPKGELPRDQFFQDAEGARAATNATYNELRDFSVHVFSWLGMTDIASDDATKGSSPGDAAQQIGSLDDLTWSTTNGSFSGTWSGYYSGVYRANQAIQNIPPIDMDTELKDRLVAENRFLRAYFYFFLVRAYGDVPKITQPLEVSEVDGITRAPRDSIYALIERDLQFAASNLPQKGNIQTARATSGAAQGLLAKAHLYQEDYDRALTAAEAVINSGVYDLPDDYFTIFREEGEFGEGSLFEVASGDLAQGGATVQYAQFQGVRGTPNLGFGFNQPSPDLESSYEPGDPRQQATILYPWEAIPDGSGAVVHVNTELTNQRYNEKAQAQDDGDNFNVTVNVRRLRYADVLLIAAEAAAETGQEGLARQYLNDVRERARGTRSLTLGLQPEQMPSQIAQVLGVSDSGPHVMSRYAAGSAANAGVQSFDAGRFEDASPVPGIVNQVDVIEAVNGTEVTSVGEYVNAVDQASDGATVSLQVLRLSQTESGGSLSTSSQSLTIGVTAETLLPDINSSGQQLLRDIWEERRHELAMEQHRWFDIVRQGRAQQLMEGVGKDWQDRYTLYPIPQTEVDRAGLEQNPGYGGE